MQTIKELEIEFSGRGEAKLFEFKQVKRTNEGYIYEARQNGEISHYEVFKRKINTMYFCVSYPTSKAFGLWAWTYPTLKLANAKLETFKTLENE